MEPMTAWNLCGNWDWMYRGQLCRVKGGRAWYSDARNTKTQQGVILSRLDTMPNGTIKRIERCVHPDTLVELGPITNSKGNT